MTTRLIPEQSFTPGPWEIEDGEFEAYIRAGKVDVARVSEDDNQVANANLIAAAPDLLAALKAVASEAQYSDGRIEECWCRTDSWLGGHESVCDQARAALKKADCR